MASPCSLRCTRSCSQRIRCCGVGTHSSAGAVGRHGRGGAYDRLGGGFAWRPEAFMRREALHATRANADCDYTKSMASCMVIGAGPAGTLLVSRLLEQRTTSDDLSEGGGPILWISRDEQFGAGAVRLYEDAPANTIAERVKQVFVGERAPLLSRSLYANGSQKIKDIFELAYAPTGGVGSVNVGGMDLRSFHPLKRIADALDLLGDAILEQGADVVQARPRTNITRLTQMHGGLWAAYDDTGERVGVARDVALAVGVQPKPPSVHIDADVIPLTTALSMRQLRRHAAERPISHAVVVGASHSGALAAMYLSEVADHVTVLHRSPVKIAINLGDQYGYLHEFTGLKGAAAGFAIEQGWTSIGASLRLVDTTAQHNAIDACCDRLACEFKHARLSNADMPRVSAKARRNVRLIASANNNGDNIGDVLRASHPVPPTHVVHACGFGRSTNDLPELVDVHGKSMKHQDLIWDAVAAEAAGGFPPSQFPAPRGLHGIGIAFPELYRSFYARDGEDVIGVGGFDARAIVLARELMKAKECTIATEF
ncbi:hypothetical protein PPROV_000537400 [Pycnococcus provasolii]|uniref:Uncharacterized protein n=1 Tax=Pycnococcus provasolii TaxID=41880 RepID=A0A830HNC8_9CHLO|nr:hypothetical protein PPROV_000537400 [Pycnococcus provasolii]